MKRIIFIYGGISGFIVVSSTLIGILLAQGEGGGTFTVWMGYLIMLIVLSVIFVGIKKYRDQECGGIVTFGAALLVGLGISAVAGAVYVAVWEIYLAMTDYAFIGDYAQSVIAAKRAAGVDAETLQATIAEMEILETRYASFLFRLPMTFIEIFPVGILISLISAAILRNRKFLPARK